MKGGGGFVKVLSVKVSDTVFSKIREEADRQQKTVSEVLRWLLNDFLNGKEKGRIRSGIRCDIIEDLTSEEVNYVVDCYINGLGNKKRKRGE